MKSPPKTAQPLPEALFTMAEQYHLAAVTLAPMGDKVRSPIYYLYSHTIELALKAYVGLHRGTVPRIHDLRKLGQRSRELGLQWSRDLDKRGSPFFGQLAKVAPSSRG